MALLSRYAETTKKCAHPDVLRLMSWVNLWLIFLCLSWRRRMTGRLGDNHGEFAVTNFVARGS